MKEKFSNAIGLSCLEDLDELINSQVQMRGKNFLTHPLRDMWPAVIGYSYGPIVRGMATVRLIYDYYYIIEILCKKGANIDQAYESVNKAMHKYKSHPYGAVIMKR